MKVQTIKITNFMPYKGKQELSFPQHETQNVMLVFGDNMRGKTSILNAIRWGFYGVALGRHLREIPRINLVNQEAAGEGDWSMSVSVAFTHKDKTYELTRAIQKRENVSIPRNEIDFKEVVGLRIDGNAVTGDSIDYEISQIMPKEVSRFFLFDGELLQEYENLLVDESDQGKRIKEHIESVLGVPALIHGRDELRVLLKSARTAQRKDAQKNDDLRKFAQNQRDLELKLEGIEDDIAALRVQEQAAQEKIDEIDDYLKNTEGVQSKKIELGRLEAEQKNAEQEIDRLAESNREMLKTVWKDVLASSVLPIVDELRRKRDTQSQEMQLLIAQEHRIGDLRKTIEDNENCGTCGQPLPNSVRKPLQEKLDKLIAERGSNEIEFTMISDCSKTIDALEEIRSEGEVGRIKENLQAATKARVQLMTVENQREEIQEEIKGFDTDEIMRRREKRDQWARQLGRIAGNVENAQKAYDQNTSKQAKISELMTKHGGIGESLSNQRAEILQGLETVFSEGIGELRQKMKVDVESFATKAFMKMTTEKTYSGLQINDSYGLSILDPDGSVLRERSAGAEQVVALALIDGLNKTSGKKAPIVMDTPLGRLDPKHRQNILTYLPDMSEQVVLLVHEGEIHAKRDTEGFASRIGVRYEITRVSATHSRIEKVS